MTRPSPSPVALEADPAAPADPFAALVAGLAQLIEAHRASATRTRGPARALLGALDATLALCRDFQALPAGWRLMDGAIDDTEGAFAGLSLVAPAAPLAAPAERCK